MPPGLEEEVTSDRLFNFVVTGYSMIDWVENDPNVPPAAKADPVIRGLRSPELTIVTQAIDRLRCSTGGAVTNEEAQETLKRRPVCPKCGNEMFLHYGIDEPDFWLCDSLACRNKRYVGGL